VDADGHDATGAIVTIDGRRVELGGPPIQVDPGRRSVAATATSGDVASQEIVVALGEKSRIVELRFGRARHQEGAQLTPTRDVPPNHPKDATSDHDRPAPTGASRHLALPLILAGLATVALGSFAYCEVVGHSSFDGLQNGCFRTKTCTDEEVDRTKRQFTAAYVSIGVSAIAIGAAIVLYLTGGHSTSTVGP
jgi:hypothetical protein